MVRRAQVPAIVAALITVVAQALSGAGAASPTGHAESSAVQKFLAQAGRPPVAYEARRRLEAASQKLDEAAWMDVVTSFDPSTGFRYAVEARGGSERIQRRVLKAVLEAEQLNLQDGEWRKGSLSQANYTFDFSGRTADGMLRMQLTPRRRDARLLLGSALVSAPSGDLVKVEGRLSKSPSFWVRWVDVTRFYAPVGGEMMPVAVETTANVRMAGLSTFTMSYEYRSVNGQAVGPADSPRASR